MRAPVIPVVYHKMNHVWYSRKSQILSYSKHGVIITDNQWARSLSTKQEAANMPKMPKSPRFVCVCVFLKTNICAHNSGHCQKLHVFLLHYSLPE